jgi:hypothetical protein
MAPQTVDYFPPTAAQKESEFQAFIASIDPSNVCSLASRHNCFKPCRIFQETANGSYSVCFFVEFDETVKWVVRIPSEPSIVVVILSIVLLIALKAYLAVPPCSIITICLCPNFGTIV